MHSRASHGKRRGCIDTEDGSVLCSFDTVGDASLSSPVTDVNSSVSSGSLATHFDPRKRYQDPSEPPPTSPNAFHPLRPSRVGNRKLSPPPHYTRPARFASSSSSTPTQSSSSEALPLSGLSHSRPSAPSSSFSTPRHAPPAGASPSSAAFPASSNASSRTGELRKYRFAESRYYVSEQELEGLKPDWLRRRKEEAERFRFEAPPPKEGERPARGKNGSTQRGKREGYTHELRNCCFLCFEEDHSGTACNNKHVFCRLCAGYGHPEDSCPLLLVERSLRGELCFFLDDAQTEDAAAAPASGSSSDADLPGPRSTHSSHSATSRASSAPAGDSRDSRGIRCMSCGVRGHAVCTDPPLTVLQIFCCRCGLYGHSRSDCPGVFDSSSRRSDFRAPPRFGHAPGSRHPSAASPHANRGRFAAGAGASPHRAPFPPKGRGEPAARERDRDLMKHARKSIQKHEGKLKLHGGSGAWHEKKKKKKHRGEGAKFHNNADFPRSRKPAEPDFERSWKKRGRDDIETSGKWNRKRRGGGI
ncbi:hypothetical protein BESB_013080 [Besnoitia besnoiti]|uniref:CCHC-type domain-containing protein n=1 Tax=Besnoitia besnoiti TaxID=94643 RepID=A0A2A9M9T8_BESBE|nr:hypothetical protein BESB_013080 [Besnoitia besnoiti]PFH32696.1 hypothetical protein BESB_013080 [Besnoitia besnoiti]